ncbi:hypothetical protein BDW69DRAFT_154825 [Aspergillus filifer]
MDDIESPPGRKKLSSKPIVPAPVFRTLAQIFCIILSASRVDCRLGPRPAVRTSATCSTVNWALMCRSRRRHWVPEQGEGNQWYHIGWQVFGQLALHLRWNRKDHYCNTKLISLCWFLIKLKEYNKQQAIPLQLNDIGDDVSCLWQVLLDPVLDLP